MCGIIAIVGQTPAAPRLLESLRRLEYRGYDSAGVATVVGDAIERRRSPGKIQALHELLAREPLPGVCGIGHTRWATHGPPTKANAHPHVAGRVAVVHNGIIENFAALRADLQARGRTFTSDTDTEVIAHLMDVRLAELGDPVAAFKATLDQLHGAYALAVIVAGEEELVLGARRGSPLVVGWGDGEMFLGSDTLAVGLFTQRVTYLEEGDWVRLDRGTAQVFDAAGRRANRALKVVPAAAALVDKGGYRHFMEKEIHEQPDSVQHTLAAYIDPAEKTACAPDGFDFANVRRIQIIACGTAYYAGQIGKYLIERWARIPVDVEIASEFRYREPAVEEGTLVLTVSQSGETLDTLEALRWCKAQGLASAALVNSHQSSMAREADRLWPTNAGPEIGVASTKAFTAQVAALTALAVAAGVQRGRIDRETEQRLVDALLGAPRLIADALQQEKAVQAAALDLSHARDVLYLGRGAMSALALEGALKLKEISYIHAEGYAAGELKHGPIALVDEATPVVVLAPSDALHDKTASNIQEVSARGGPVTVVTDATGRGAHSGARREIVVPDCDDLVAPLVFAVPVQLLAYHTAVLKGTDVDQPRNLAKSVTVE